MIKLKDILNEKVEGGKVICDKCGWNWKISDGGDDTYMCHKCGNDNTPIGEDLRKWFGKGPTGGWDRYNSKGEKAGKCGDSEKGSAYAACLSNEKAAKLGKDGIAAFVKRKRAAQSKAGDSKKGGEQSKGQKPTFVKTGASEGLEEKLNLFLEKNVPTDPAKWAASKAAAKRKFDVYPSAYANGWAAKNYKAKGGGWKTEK